MNRKPLDDEALIAMREGGPDGRRELEAAARDDPHLMNKLAEWDRQDAALRTLYGPVADEPIPGRLLEITRPQTSRRAPMLWSRIAALIAIFAIGAVAGWTGARFMDDEGPAMSLAAEAMRAHSTYVVEVIHPVEVPGTESEHLANWLSKRVGQKFSPPDFDSLGFRLMGGRIVPVQNGAAALMMYEDGTGRRLTLYVARELDAKETAFRFVEGSNVNGFWWVDGNFGYAILGDFPRDVLRSVAVSAYDQLV